MDHFQGLARAHFTVRRLERTYGEEAIRTAFERLHDEIRDKGAADPHAPVTEIPASSLTSVDAPPVEQ